MPQRLQLSQYVPAGGYFHFAHCVFPQTGMEVPHAHNFCEVMWCVEGVGNHLCNGVDMALRRGDMLFIAADDAHCFRAPGGRRWTLVNLAFACTVMTDLQTRYPETMARMLARDATGAPCVHPLTEADLESLQQAAVPLAAASQSRLLLDGFLLYLLRIADQRGVMSARDTAMPEWLAHAAAESRRTPHLTAGMPAFVRLAGRCQEHVTRETRKWLGKTPGDLILEARLLHAQRLLAASGMSLKEVCGECGLSSQSYFHRIFQARFHCTPRRYRLVQQSIAAPGER